MIKKEDIEILTWHLCYTV